MKHSNKPLASTSLLLWIGLAVANLVILVSCSSSQNAGTSTLTELAPGKTTVVACPTPQLEPDDPPLFSDAEDVMYQDIDWRNSENQYQMLCASIITRITSYKSEADPNAILKFYKAESLQDGWLQVDSYCDEERTPRVRFIWEGPSDQCFPISPSGTPLPVPTEECCQPIIELHITLEVLKTGKTQVTLINAFQPGR